MTLLPSSLRSALIVVEPACGSWLWFINSGPGLIFSISVHNSMTGAVLLSTFKT